MVVRLSYSRAVPGIPFPAFFIRITNSLINVVLLFRKPRQQCGPEIETDVAVVIDDPLNVIKAVENSRRAIRRVTFRGDAFVPIMEWISRVLQLDEFEPCVFAGRLVKVAVDTDV